MEGSCTNWDYNNVIALRFRKVRFGLSNLKKESRSTYRVSKGNSVMNTFDIPLQCPTCSGQMYITRYEAPLNVLRERSWQICKNCDFEQQTDDFKKKLLTV